MTSGLSEAIAASPVTASIGGTVVTGFYTPNEQSGQLGYGGMIEPQGSEFVYLTADVSAPHRIWRQKAGDGHQYRRRHDQPYLGDPGGR
ncbi:hypothetical protein EBX31_10695 [bacterium]|nr:hypothetical protein [bacterium]